jgi:hypothetical protein
VSLVRRNPKRDGNERDIITALEKIGALVVPLSAPGVPDLLVGFRRHWWLLEVKTAKGALTREQLDFRLQALTHELPCTTVRTVDEALRALGVQT